MGKGIFKTAFKDWGVVNFLQDKVGKSAGDIAKNVGDVVLKGESPVKAVMDIIRGEGGTRLTQKDIMKAVELAEKDMERYQMELEFEKLHNEGVANARDAEIRRLQSSDNALTRNMNTIIALTVIIGYFLIVGLVVFQEISPESRRLVDIAFGAIGSSLVTIIGYYFHRSQREDKIIPSNLDDFLKPKNKSKQ